MFRGLNAINVDDKGRLAVPKRYRERLAADCSGQLVLTIDTEASCLLLYPLPEWEVIEAKIQALPSFNPVARRIQRLLIGHATEIEMDGNGRILIPTILREYADLNKRIMLVGQGKKFEVWDELQWQSGREQWLAAEAKADPEQMPEELKDISI